MRPIRVALNAAGYSAWIPVDWRAKWFGIGVGVVLSEDANLTYTVQHTFDSVDPRDYNDNNTCSVSRAGTVATVTDIGPYSIGHGLSTGDSVIISGTGSTQLDSQSGNPPSLNQNGVVGWNVASTPSPTSFTYAVANAGPTADLGLSKIIRLRVFPSNLAAQTARGTMTYNYAVRAVRLYVSAYTAGYADMTVLQSSI